MSRVEARARAIGDAARARLAERVRERLAALLDALAGQANGVFEGAAVEAAPPYAEIGAILSGDWGSKDPPGRELRVAVTVTDRAERPARAMTLAGLASEAVEGLARDLDGWRIASLVFVRGRTVSLKPGWWAAGVEYRVRVLKI